MERKTVLMDQTKLQKCVSVKESELPGVFTEETYCSHFFTCFSMYVYLYSVINRYNAPSCFFW